jgi:membrane protein DedA with SNARE-associated domain
MKIGYSRSGLVLSLVYLAVFLLAGGYAIYSLVFNTANSELSGVPAILVAMPWSLVVVPIVNGLGYVSWYGHFAGQPALYGFLAMLGLLPAALLNMIILYFIGSIIDKIMSKNAKTGLSLRQMEDLPPSKE